MDTTSGSTAQTFVSDRARLGLSGQQGSGVKPAYSLRSHPTTAEDLEMAGDSPAPVVIVHRPGRRSALSRVRSARTRPDRAQPLPDVPEDFTLAFAIPSNPDSVEAARARSLHRARKTLSEAVLSASALLDAISIVTVQSQTLAPERALRVGRHWLTRSMSWPKNWLERNTRGRQEPEARTVLRALLGLREIIWKIQAKPKGTLRREARDPTLAPRKQQGTFRPTEAAKPCPMPSSSRLTQGLHRVETGVSWHRSEPSRPARKIGLGSTYGGVNSLALSLKARTTATSKRCRSSSNATRISNSTIPRPADTSH